MFDMYDMYKAFVIWMLLNPEWNREAAEEASLSRWIGENTGILGRRQHGPRTAVSAAIVRRMQEEYDGATSC